MHTPSPPPDPARAAPSRRRGNRLGFWFFITSLRLTGLHGAYGLLYFVCAYYLLFDRRARAASLAYIRRRYPEAGWLRRQAAVYRLFINQGKSLIDRHCRIAGHDPFQIELRGVEQVESLLRTPQQGFVLLTGHLGNWQMIMPALERFNRTIYLLMRPEDNPAVQSALRIDRAQGRIHIISPDTFLGGIPEAIKRLQEGALVSIMGDRRYQSRTVPVTLLGAPAVMPFAAFSLAAAVECPVVALFSAKTGTTRYRVEIAAVMHPRYRPGTPKQQQLQGWVQQFAGLLEAYLQTYPLQFFLFEDMWPAADSEPRSPR